MLRLFDAFVQKKEHRPHLPFVGVDLILDEGIALVYSSGFVIVVVEPIVLRPDFLGYRTPELRQLPGLEGGIECNGKDSEPLHIPGFSIPPKIKLYLDNRAFIPCSFTQATLPWLRKRYRAYSTRRDYVLEVKGTA